MLGSDCNGVVVGAGVTGVTVVAFAEEVYVCLGASGVFEFCCCCAVFLLGHLKDIDV